jgi:hypothetical protein
LRLHKQLMISGRLPQLHLAVLSGCFRGDLREVAVRDRNDLDAAVLGYPVRQNHRIGAQRFTDEPERFATRGTDEFADVHLPPDELALTLICCG